MRRVDALTTPAAGRPEPAIAAAGAVVLCAAAAWLVAAADFVDVALAWLLPS